jgi:predicted transposase/invertase (TIGR01784 family)
VLHAEFQTEPDSTMPFRMADYHLRVFRRFPQKQMRQVVIYLTPTGSDLVHQTVFETAMMRHKFEAIRLWEQPTQPFLESTGLLPLAVLTQTSDKAQTLREVAARVEAISDNRTQSNVAASAGILAGLTLKRDFINQVLRREIMQQSVIYQEWREEFLQEGRQEGQREEGLALVLRLLNRRIGIVEPDVEAQVRGLSLGQIEELGEALLDFRESADLQDWLRSNR